MVKLADLGFKSGLCCETIVSTYNPDGSANAAPMGLKLIDEHRLSMSIFNTSRTCQNLKIKKSAVVNLTNNVEVYYKTTCKEANPQGIVPQKWFVKADVVDAPKVQAADGAVEVSVSKIAADGAERTAFTCKVEKITSTTGHPQVYSRAMPLTIEAITHATRVKVFINDPSKQKETAQLIELIQRYSGVVERVAPNSEFTAVFDDLLSRIEAWRAEA
jgi:uncharacterized protein